MNKSFKFGRKNLNACSVQHFYIVNTNLGQGKLCNIKHYLKFINFLKFNFFKAMKKDQRQKEMWRSLIMTSKTT